MQARGVFGLGQSTSTKCKDCSGMTQGMWTWAQGVQMASSFLRSQSCWASMRRTGTSLTHLKHGHRTTVWGCRVVSGTRAFSVSPLSPICCKVWPPRIRLIPTYKSWGISKSSLEDFVTFLHTFKNFSPKSSNSYRTFYIRSSLESRIILLIGEYVTLWNLAF